MRFLFIRSGFTYQYGTQDLNFLLWFDLTNHDLLNFQQTTAYPLQNYACSVDVSDLGEEPRDVGLIMPPISSVFLCEMAGFRIRRHFSLYRFNMKGGGLIGRLGSKPRVKRQSLRALQAAIAEREAQNNKIRKANELWVRWIREANMWVHHLLPLIENDPSIRDAMEKLNIKKN
ncbi:hypothetical protein V6N11_019314 [Hibiscus sabdariffa]|uniref:Uncharacterized protein n=1 Tax=Hibiscus sabdariffa TaxID=183260 RepID=A0ABR2R2I6_9ROSI